METRVFSKYFVGGCSMNNLKTKVNDLDVDKLKIFPLDFKKAMQ